MRAVILAAGIGQRLQGSGHNGPKCMLAFDGVTLLERHLHCLDKLGIEDISICVGYQAEKIANLLSGSLIGKNVQLIMNPDYRSGSIVSLWTTRDKLRHTEDVILMDADVLYTPAIIERLLTSHIANCLLMDREFEAGDEPLKICLNNGRIVEFRKQIASNLVYTACGESVGFFRFTPEVGAHLAEFTEQYVSEGRRDEPYEEAIRDLVLAYGTVFGVEDITGLPWTEIDFPEDIVRAREEILPIIHGR